MERPTTGAWIVKDILIRADGTKAGAQRITYALDLFGWPAVEHLMDGLQLKQFDLLVMGAYGIRLGLSFCLAVPRRRRCFAPPFQS